MPTMRTRTKLVLEPKSTFRQELSFTQRMLIRRAHPRYLIAGIVGAIWAFYFLWQHNWSWAVGVILMSAIAGGMLTSNVSEEYLAETTLGKIMSIHLHPANIAIQSLGLIFLVYGIWIHSALFTMGAVSAILVGHMWGWEKVNPAL